jgi:hypothetical protein
MLLDFALAGGAEDVARTIQLIIAPTVLLSVCTLIQNGILARYSSIGDRMRNIDRDRLRLIQTETSEMIRVEGLRILDEQVPVFIRRHKLLQDAALVVYIAIFMLLLSMFAIALAVLFNSNLWAITALVLFLLGAAAVSLGVAFTAQEIRISHQAICSELRRISALESLQQLHSL